VTEGVEFFTPRHDPIRRPLSVVQSWVQALPLMQQTVLLTAIRGPDGSPKYGPTKMLVRWLRRCVLLGSFERAAFTSPHQLGGGSFTGPSIPRHQIEAELLRRANVLFSETLILGSTETDWATSNRLAAASDAQIVAEFDLSDGDWTPFLDQIVGNYLREMDALPHHFQLHLMHAAEILGYKHPEPRTRTWWNKTYERLVHDMHLWPETEAQLDDRLGDSREGWLARNDIATVD
jgi:hypothetical protein